MPRGDFILLAVYRFPSLFLLMLEMHARIFCTHARWWVRLICVASLKCLARQARQTATTAPRAAILLNSERRRHGRPVRKDYPTPAVMMHEYHPFTSPTWNTHVRCASPVRGQVLGNDRTGRERGTPPVTPAMTTEQRGGAFGARLMT